MAWRCCGQKAIVDKGVWFKGVCVSSSAVEFVDSSSVADFVGGMVMLLRMKAVVYMFTFFQGMCVSSRAVELVSSSSCS